jgi:glutamyl-tRNA synthetase
VRTTRLAPSPTGALHLGNARTFLVNWLIARQQNWRIILRIEDIDGPRIKPGAAEQALNDLRWLGLDWDDGPVYQSAHRAEHDAAVARLLAQKDAYPCICTRREVELAASAPHAEDGSAVYPGTCRGRYNRLDDAAAAAGGRRPAIRFAVSPGAVEFADAIHGPQSIDAAAMLGDFVIAKSDGTPAYQLAVVVDDARAGITDIVRGDDLLDSTPRQILLYRALGLTGRIPRYTHLPLVVGTDGRRLAKRHGDTRLAHYRAAGVGAGDVLRRLARWSGIDPPPTMQTAGDLVGRLDLDRLPRAPVMLDPRAEPLLGVESPHRT